MRQVVIKLTIAVLAFVIGLSAAAMFGNLRRSVHVHKRSTGCSVSKSQMTSPPSPSLAPLAPLPSHAPASGEAKFTYSFSVKEKSKDGKTYRTVEQPAGSMSSR